MTAPGNMGWGDLKLSSIHLFNLKSLSMRRRWEDLCLSRSGHPPSSQSSHSTVCPDQPPLKSVREEKSRTVATRTFGKIDRPPRLERVGLVVKFLSSSLRSCDTIKRIIPCEYYISHIYMYNMACGHQPIVKFGLRSVVKYAARVSDGWRALVRIRKRMLRWQSRVTRGMCPLCLSHPDCSIPPGPTLTLPYPHSNLTMQYLVPSMDSIHLHLSN